MTAASLAAASRIVEQLLAHNIHDVVLAPGSRNSPFAFALAEAEAAGTMRVHVRSDERTASFLSLGIARVTGRPAPVVVTSGTAAAHCYPAIIEAFTSRIPMLVITADRPQRLHGVASSQTINHTDLFGRYAHCVDTSAEEIVYGHPGTAHAIVQQLLQHPTGQLNISFDNPLVPLDDEDGDSDYAAQPCDELVAQQTAGAAMTALPPLYPSTNYGHVELDLSRRTLVVAGDLSDTYSGLKLVPTIAEPTVVAPDYPLHPLALDLIGTQDFPYPEQIVVTGKPTLHRRVMKLLARREIPVIVLSSSHEAFRPPHANHQLASTVTVTGELDAQWLDTVAAAHTKALSVVDEYLLESSDFTGLEVAEVLGAELGAGDRLFIGSSSPIRDTSLVGFPVAGVESFAQRGVAGIDGAISHAIGLSLGYSGHSFAFLGDLTFLHDIGGLNTSFDDYQPAHLCLVVSNDSGGAIFEALEIGADAHRTLFEKYAAAHHTADLGALVTAFGHHHEKVTDRESLRAAIASSRTRSGITVVEAVTTRAGRRRQAAALSLKNQG